VMFEYRHCEEPIGRRGKPEIYIREATRQIRDLHI
jgi:hypothetical protein